jgi:hypothetical protein
MAPITGGNRSGANGDRIESKSFNCYSASLSSSSRPSAATRDCLLQPWMPRVEKSSHLAVIAWVFMDRVSTC